VQVHRQTDGLALGADDRWQFGRDCADQADVVDVVDAEQSGHQDHTHHNQDHDHQGGLKRA
jgi:hypothetical protein